MRIRSVFPGQWSDDEFVQCSHLARLFVLAIRNFSDDRGVFEWNPIKLKMLCLPADNCDPAALLQELEERRQVRRFEHGGRQYGAVRNFLAWQKPKKPSFKYPFPTGPEFIAFIGGGGSEPVPNQFGNSSAEGGGRREEGDGGGRKEAQPEPCPHDEIIAVYHEVLPTLPRVRQWTDKRKGYLRARWNEAAERQSVDWWRDFFEYVKGCPFLIGKVDGRGGRASFEADLEWLVTEGNFVKVIEGKYEPKGARL